MEKIKYAVIGFLFGVLLTGVGLGWWILDQRGTIDRLGEQLESADQSLVRGQKRVVHIIVEIERVRVQVERIKDDIGEVKRGIDTNSGRLGEVQEGLEGSLDILRTIRGQRLD